MTLAELVTDLKNMIGPSVTVDDAGLITWINDSYLQMVDEVHKAIPDHFAKSSTSTTLDGQIEYELPSDFDKMVMVNIQYDDTWQRAVPMNNIGSVPIHASNNVSFSGAAPQYYLIGDYIGVEPAPTATGQSIKIWYTYTPTSMIDDEDSPQLPVKYHHIIKYGAYANFLDQDDEHVAAQRMRENFNLRIWNMVEQLSERQVDEPKSVQVTHNQDLYMHY